MRGVLGDVRADVVEEIANQAADEVLMALLGKLDRLQGRSRFTTWAYKFAVLQAATAVRAHAWRDREVHLAGSEPMNPRTRPLGPDAVSRLTLDTSPWLSCDACFEHVDEYVERALARRPGMPAMTVHLRGCPACAEEAATPLTLAAEDAGVDPAPALHRAFGQPD